MKLKTNPHANGFVALFTVMTIGFLAGIFVLSSSERVWLQAKSAGEALLESSLRFSALSCVHIARLKIYSAEEEIVGEYNLISGKCEIENLRLSSNQIIIKTSSEKDNTKISLETILDSHTLGIISFMEF